MNTDCEEPLYLTQVFLVGECHFGLVSISSISCSSCGHVNSVETDKHFRPAGQQRGPSPFSVNERLALGMSVLLHFLFSSLYYIFHTLSCPYFFDQEDRSIAHSCVQAHACTLAGYPSLLAHTQTHTHTHYRKLEKESYMCKQLDYAPNIYAGPKFKVQQKLFFILNYICNVLSFSSGKQIAAHLQVCKSNMNAHAHTHTQTHFQKKVLSIRFCI